MGTNQGGQVLSHPREEAVVLIYTTAFFIKYAGPARNSWKRG